MKQPHAERQDSERDARLHKLSNWLICGVVLVAAYLAIAEHWAHLSPVLPYALLLACPLIHLFMHRNHGHSSHHRDSTPRKAPVLSRESDQPEDHP